MQSNTARIVGILFCVQLISAAVANGIAGGVLKQIPLLQAISDNVFRLRLAMFLDLICGASVFAISVLMFRILKPVSERAALWYLGLRLNEWVMMSLGGILLLTMISINKGAEYSAATIEAITQTLRKTRGQTFNIMLLGFCLSGIIFYYTLFKGQLIPRFISIWGLAGVILIFIEMIATLSGRSLGGIYLMLPMGFNELFLGVWLIVKGFNKVPQQDAATF